METNTRRVRARPPPWFRQTSRAFAGHLPRISGVSRLGKNTPKPPEKLRKPGPSPTRTRGKRARDTIKIKFTKNTKTMNRKTRHLTVETLPRRAGDYIIYNRLGTPCLRRLPKNFHPESHFTEAHRINQDRIRYLVSLYQALEGTKARESWRDAPRTTRTTSRASRTSSAACDFPSPAACGEGAVSEWPIMPLRQLRGRLPCFGGVVGCLDGGAVQLPPQSGGNAPKGGGGMKTAFRYRPFSRERRLSRLKFTVPLLRPML